MKFVATLLLLASTALAQQPTTAAVPGDASVARWLNRVSEIQSQQPHWITPVVTVTPRLEQEFRFDVNRQGQNSGLHQWGLGGGKGLELIPFHRVEIILGEPNYVVHNNPKLHDGFADETFLLKYRIASANEEHGNYILTAFLGASLPTASYKNGLTDASVTPTVAAGKGYGNAALQTTLGIQLPTENSVVIGKTLVWNTALQYHLKHWKAWPELENNQNHFIDGPNSGHTQNFLTPGVVLGRFPLHHRLAFTGGVGYQIATSRFHTYNHNVIVTLRLPF